MTGGSLAIASAFGAEGALSRALMETGHAYEPRPEQATMARAVARTMALPKDQRTPLLVEAGTGVGKSLAYLLPAADRIANHAERVVVATHTIALQEQLLGKDVPILKRALALAGLPDLKVALVKGRGNYVSVRRLKMASERQDRLFVDAPSKRSLHAIEEWAYTTEDGTLATLPQLERPGVWERAESDSGNCMGRKCPTYDRCFYQRARREMEQADLLICNHALFFSDLALRAGGSGFLPEHRHVVLDEAHNVEDVASEHFGASLSEGRVRRLLSTLHHRSGRGFLSSLRADGATVDRAVSLTRECEEASLRTFDALLRAGPGAGAPGSTARIPGPVEDSHGLGRSFADLALCLKRLREQAEREEDKYELNAYAERATAIGAEGEALLGQTIPDCVYWLESTRRDDGTVRATLACSPVEVGPMLRARLFDGRVSVTLCSATLATGGRTPATERPDGPRVVGLDEEDRPAPSRRPAKDPFGHAKARLGCAEAETLLLGSPFEHARLVEFYVDRTIPDPRAPGYAERVAEAVIEHARATGGGAFVLFTSFDSLRRVAGLARAALEAEGMPVLVQEGGAPGAGMSRAALLGAFRENDRSVLFGTASFWQGVDVRGRGLRNVIITRLPFEPPDRPLTQARLERIESQGGDAFLDDSLPRAVLRFKQGFGRLVRSREDHGRVVVLDPRIVTKGYGKAFLEALPEGVTVRQAGGARAG